MGHSGRPEILVRLNFISPLAATLLFAEKRIREEVVEADDLFEDTLENVG